MRFGIGLAWRYALGRRRVRSLLGPFAATGLLTILFVVLNSFALSGAQQADRDLGWWDHAITLPAPFGSALSKGLADRLTAAVAAAGTATPQVALESLDVRPDALPQQFNTGAHDDVVTYLEDDSIPSGFPGSYELRDGRWPTRPGEVVLSTALDAELRRPTVVAALAGSVHLTVVGTVVPTYARESFFIIAGSGTWRTIPQRVHRGFPSAGALWQVRWTGTTPAVAVAQAIHRVEPRIGQDSLLTGVKNRSEYRARMSLTEGFAPILLGPAVLLTVAAAMIVVALNGAWLRRDRERLVAVGISPRTVSIALPAALGAGILASSCLGALTGLWAALGLRQWPVASLSPQPLSPVVSPLPLAAGMTALATSLGVLGSARIISRRSTTARLSAVWRRVPWSTVRRIAALATVVTAVPTVSGASSVQQLGHGALQIVAGALLLSPDLWLLLLPAVCPNRAVPLVVKRLIESDLSRHRAALFTVAACLALPIAVATYSATDTRTAAAANISLVPPGDAVVQAADSDARTAARIGTKLTRGLGVSPVEVAMVLDRNSYSSFSTKGTTGANALWVFDSVDAARRLLGAALTGRGADVLANGGVVDWSGATGPQSIATQRGHAEPVSSRPLNTVDLQVDPSFAYLAAGAMLSSTAHDLSLSTSPALYVFTDLTDQEIAEVPVLLAAAHINPRLVAVHTVPPPTRPTAQWYVAGGGLTLVGFVVLWSILGAQARNLRRYAGRLLALGLGAGWSVRVLLVETGLTLVGGATVGIASGVVPIVLFAGDHRLGIVLDVPWDYIGLLLTATAAAAGTAIGGSLLRLNAREGVLDL